MYCDSKRCEWLLVVLIVFSFMIDVIAQDPDYYNCQEYCSIPFYGRVSPGNLAFRANFPKLFKLHFDYFIPNVAFEISNSTNLFTIYCRKKEYLKVDIAPSSKMLQLSLYGVQIINDEAEAGLESINLRMDYDRPDKIKKYFSTVWLELQQQNIMMDNGIDPPVYAGIQYLLDKGKPKKWGTCDVYISQPGWEYNPGTFLRNFQIICK